MVFMPCRNAGECADTVVDLCSCPPQRYGWDMDADIQVITPSSLACAVVFKGQPPPLKQVMDEAAAGLLKRRI